MKPAAPGSIRFRLAGALSRLALVIGGYHDETSPPGGTPRIYLWRALDGRYLFCSKCREYRPTVGKAWGHELSVFCGVCETRLQSFQPPPYGKPGNERPRGGYSR
jgi:hypothetical protein